MTRDMGTVARIMAAECRLPLPRPITLGPVTIRTRDVVALRLVTDAGVQGDALAYTRDTPLLATLQHIAGRFLGTSPLARNSAVHRFGRAMTNGGSAFVRAVSMIDLALSDAAARGLDLPLFKLLGGDRRTIPAMPVAGYYQSERSHADIASEVAAHVDGGFRQVKIMLGGGDPADDRALVQAVSAVSAGRLGVDAHWSWTSLPEALATCRAIDDIGLRFIEDPFGPAKARLLGRLQSLLTTPLAAGEDSPDVESLAALTRDIGILRVDATTCGGIAAACAAITVAGLAGVEVLPHVHLPLHAQLAAACPEIRFVEFIPEAVGADPLHLLLRRQPTIVDGEVRLDDEPGVGTFLDWTAVEQYCAASFTLDAQT